MKKSDGEKNYTMVVADGKVRLSMNDKGADGRYHAITSSYPIYIKVLNADGEYESKKLTRKQTETYLLNQLN